MQFFLLTRKAFDYLNRDCLWYKRFHNGGHGKIIDMIQGMYSEIKLIFKYLGSSSEVFVATNEKVSISIC